MRPDAPVTATLVLRRKAEPGDADFAQTLTSAQLEQQFGASTEDVTLIHNTLEPLGVTVLSTDAASRRIQIQGPAAIMTRIFGTSLMEVAPTDQQGNGQRHRTGALSIPQAWSGVVTAVLGLDNRPQSRAFFRLAPASSRGTSYTPIELGSVYNFPTTSDGTGTSIAILELGGGFAQQELDTYFSSLNVKPAPVRVVSVDGANNVAGTDPQGADGEVLLDLEVAGALAPGAQLVAYFAPNTDAGFVNALSEAAHANTPPAAISISWGASEDSWTAQARTALDQAAADAVLLGITVIAAAGDDGSTNRAADGTAHVDFPASSPHILACGGTRLETDAAGKVTSETVWNNGKGAGATGGGISHAFPLPGWQKSAGVPTAPTGNPPSTGGRGVPDVAAVADPQTGYQVLVDGTHSVIGGTSAVAPLWAALVSRLSQEVGKPLGLIQTLLYASASAGHGGPGFRDITSGNNGAFAATPGWDACTGLGVPNGGALISVVSR